MINHQNKKNKPIVIVGAGITGLACAYFLKKTGRPIYIIEKSKQAGGLLSCFKHNGYTLEKFYHHFFNEDAELKQLIQHLKLEQSFQSFPSSVGIEHQGQFFPFTTVKDLLNFTPLSFINRIRFGVCSLILGKLLNWKHYHHISAYAWFLKYVGKQATKIIWQPMMMGKFSDAYKTIPLAWFIGRLKQRMSSRKQSGAESLYYIMGSIENFITNLIKDLKQSNISMIYEDQIHTIESHDNSITQITTKNGLSFDDPYLILTTPSHVSADLLKTVDVQLSQTLKSIEYYHAHCMVLILKKSLSPVYWLNITDSKSPFVGIIEHTNLIPKHHYNNDHIVYLTKYSLNTDPLVTMGEDLVKKIFLQHLKKKFPGYNFNENLNTSFLFHSSTAAPVFPLNFDQRLKNCQSKIKNFHLSMMPHVYPDERSVNNAIRIAYNTCKKAGFDLEPLAQGNNIAAKII
ncbi:MAG TPA: FAD-dependent oxidoreductase [Oligoflexia bacterium]|nr:FAD-dependent oxidoreductase [Oligoflexia bacterium]HMR24974.1 FAD-dependent oxidoreductase [Oligoflexia bacterium]